MCAKNLSPRNAPAIGESFLSPPSHQIVGSIVFFKCCADFSLDLEHAFGLNAVGLSLELCSFAHNIQNTVRNWRASPGLRFYALKRNCAKLHGLKRLYRRLEPCRFTCCSRETHTSGSIKMP